MNKKKIIDTIKKVAQELSDPPGVDSKPKPAAQPSINQFLPKTFDARNLINKNNVKSRPASYSLSSVKDMQKAILNFANAASATDVTSLKGNQQGQQYGEQTRTGPLDLPESNDLSHKDDNRKEYLGGSDPFGNFITENYIPKDSFTGKQYLNVDVAGNKARETHSNMPMNLRGIIDSMKRVGTPGSTGTEKSVDGIWQTRTNNALHIAADLIEAMLNFTADMKINVSGFSAQTLQQFKSKIPNNYTDLKGPEEIKQRALELTPYLVSATTFFENLKPSVFNNTKIREYIDQKVPFAKYEKVEIPDDMRNQGIPGVHFEWIHDPKKNWISLNELSTPEAFKGFVRRMGVDDKDPEAVKKFLDLVSQKINLQRDPGF